MKRFIYIVFLMALCQAAWGQGGVYLPDRFKGASHDGYDRSAHTIVLSKIIPPSSLCEGDTAVFSINHEGTFLYTFQWKKVGDSRESWGATSVMKIENVTTAHRGLYFCVVKDMKSGRLIHSDTVELKINKTPTALIGDPVSPFMMCGGTTSTLNAIASENDKEAGDEYSYTWSGVDIVGANNLSEVQISPKKSTTYTVTVLNGVCRDTASLFVEVYNPEVDIPDVIYLAEGMPLTVDVDIPATATLEWKVGNTTLSHQNPLVFNGLLETTPLYVKMEDRGCVAVDSGTVYIKGSWGYRGGMQDGFSRSNHSFIIKDIVHSGTVCEGERATFSIDYEGTFALKYAWRKIGNNEILGDTSVLNMDETGIDDRGEYYCVLKDPLTGREFYSDTVELRVKKLPDAVIGSPVSPTLVCHGDTIILNASASEDTKEEGDEYTYSWSGEGIVSASNLPLVRVSPRQTTTYTVR